MITHTKTHTRFFDQEILEQLTALTVNMQAEWESRSAFIDEETRARGDARILTLFAALMLCAESVE